MSDDVSPKANDGEPIATPGLSGVGKLISSNSTGGTEYVMNGETTANGNNTVVHNDKKSMKHRVMDAGPAP